MRLTKALLLITRTPALPPLVLRLRTMCVRLMFVPNLVEELNLVFPRKQTRSDTVHWGISPTLFTRTFVKGKNMTPCAEWVNAPHSKTRPLNLSS
jgi:hypothetical protein